MADTSGRDEPNAEWSLDAVFQNGGIVTHFQPIVSVMEGKVIGLEALSRGRTADGQGLIGPVDLFAEAARTGRLLELDRACRDTALRRFRELRRLYPDLLLWLNLEASVIDELGVTSGYLHSTVKELGLDPNSIVVEIVESKVKNVEALMRFAQVYQGHGFLIALDDVGAGYSNLERISMLKPHVIKTDRSLIRGVDAEYHKKELLGSIVKLAHQTGALLVAEGVETMEEAIAVQDLNVDFLQGFLFARPGPDVDQIMDKSQASTARVIDSFKRHARRVQETKSRRARHFEGITTKIVVQLIRMPVDEFEKALILGVAEHPDIECVYVLNESGVQVTETVYETGRWARERAVIFRPSQRGADQSLKSYFLLISMGLQRYISDPYISRASGNPCVTVSQSLFDSSGDRFVLCVDFNVPDLR
jgi:EAL domain-containing protein (putative c-di-GMP-specific phosphodiesterase class I)